MASKTSPGGSIFPYGYKGGEIFGLHLGGFHVSEEGLLARMKAEEEFIAETHRQFPLWIDFYETKLTERVLIEFLNSVYRSRGNIIKLGIVGCSWWDKRRLNRLKRKYGIELSMPMACFGDPEVAKTWLVSET